MGQPVEQGGGEPFDSFLRGRLARIGRAGSTTPSGFETLHAQTASVCHWCQEPYSEGTVVRPVVGGGYAHVGCHRPVEPILTRAEAQMILRPVTAVNPTPVWIVAEPKKRRSKPPIIGTPPPKPKGGPFIMASARAKKPKTFPATTTKRCGTCKARFEIGVAITRSRRGVLVHAGGCPKKDRRR